MPKKVAKAITVLTADDEPIVRAGIRALLALAKDIEVVGEAKDGFEVKELVSKMRPQVLLLDLKMPGPRPSEIEKWVRENYPETVTLILTSHDRDSYLSTMMDAGVAAFLSKQASAERLIGAIRRAAEGAVYFTDEQINRVLQWKEKVQEKWKTLTNREREIIQRLLIGEDNKVIAKHMKITIKTVEFHVSNILKKLNMKSRDEVIIWVLKHRPDMPDNIKD
jgi:Response regulator containing a CheY-like receiver domain and an HTH DNA-binding domain